MNSESDIQGVTQEFTVTVKLKETFVRNLSKAEVAQWVKESLNEWKTVKVLKVEETV